jgi:hypothetical protein
VAGGRNGLGEGETDRACRERKELAIGEERRGGGRKGCQPLKAVVREAEEGVREMGAVFDDEEEADFLEWWEAADLREAEEETREGGLDAEDMEESENDAEVALFTLGALLTFAVRRAPGAEAERTGIRAGRPRGRWWGNLCRGECDRSR